MNPASRLRRHTGLPFATLAMGIAAATSGLLAKIFTGRHIADEEMQGR